MRHTDNSTKAFQKEQLVNRMIIGGGIGVLVISFLLIPSEPNPEWGTFWMVRPLIVTPVAGATGGLCNYLIMKFYPLVGLNKTIARILSILVPFIGLYIGVVLGLDGTLWD
jgi:hypothetical protein